MGLIRVLLSLSVVSSHILGDGALGVPGKVAVELFFLISGYLIAEVLQAGRYASTKHFYFARAMRIFPLYWFVLGLTVSFNLLLVGLGYESPIIDFISKLSWQSASFIASANVMVVGQGLSAFLGPTFFETYQFSLTPIAESLQQGLIVPQAWSLDLEILFYLAAPFVLRSHRGLLLCFGVSLSLEIATGLAGLSNSDPWSHRLFPSEVWIFLLGALVQRFGTPIYRASGFVRSRQPLQIVGFLAVFLILVYSQIPLDAEYKYPIVFIAVLISLPHFFSSRNQSKIDRYLADITFPIYMSHFLIFQVLVLLSGQFGAPSAWLVFTAVSAGSVAFGVIWLRYSHRAVEALRLKFKIT